MVNLSDYGLHLSLNNYLPANRHAKTYLQASQNYIKYTPLKTAIQKVGGKKSNKTGQAKYNKK